jgi:3-mercaptopyruvate sulfurtransferase SseA
MLHLLALAAAATSAGPIVSTAWLQAHLSDPQVHVVYVGERGDYDRGHVPGARALDHMDTVEMGPTGHHLAANDALIRALAKVGAADGVRVVLYGDSPMATGWVNTALAVIGHGDDVSWLDGGIAAWRAEHRPVETTAPPPGTGPLTLRPSSDLIVDAAYVRSHLNAPTTKVLDVRTDKEWKDGHVPNATLILWQDLFADVKTQKFKSIDEIRALLAGAGVAPNQDVITYCAVGMRASLMAWAARAAGIPARIYLASWQEWSRGRENPVAK